MNAAADKDRYAEEQVHATVKEEGIRVLFMHADCIVIPDVPARQVKFFRQLSTEGNKNNLGIIIIS